MSFEQQQEYISRLHQLNTDSDNNSDTEINQNFSDNETEGEWIPNTEIDNDSDIEEISADNNLQIEINESDDGEGKYKIINICKEKNVTNIFCGYYNFIHAALDSDDEDVIDSATDICSFFRGKHNTILNRKPSNCNHQTLSIIFYGRNQVQYDQPNVFRFWTHSNVYLVTSCAISL